VYVEGSEDLMVLFGLAPTMLQAMLLHNHHPSYAVSTYNTLMYEKIPDILHTMWM
jgi:hypothetical protein